MITAAQLRAARVLLGVDQRRLAELSGLSLPTIQRMETSEAMVRGNVDSLMKLIVALDTAGIEIIGEGAASHAGAAGCGSGKNRVRPKHLRMSRDSPEPEQGTATVGCSLERVDNVAVTP